MKKSLAVVAACASSIMAHAQTPEFRFSGFGTLGATITNTDEAQYRANFRQSKGADESPDIGVDSRLGLQADVKFNNTFTAVGQLLTLRRDGSDQPRVEWLYGQADAAAGLKLRLGRMVLPSYLLSDSRAVGYSAHWLRSPREVYDGYFPTSFDGGQALYSFAVGGFNVELQGSLGNAKANFYLNGLPPLEWQIHKLSSLSATVTNGDWTARIGQTLSRDLTVDAPNAPLVFSLHSRDAFTDYGLQYDNGRILAMGEYTTRNNDQGYSNKGYYVSAGYRFGTLMPYATYSNLHYSGAAFRGAPDDKTKSIGLRWDVYKNVALKAQVDRADTPSALINETPGFAAHPTPINATSVVVDFVF